MESCTSVRIYVVVDNYVDMLSANEEHVKRLRMDYQFSPKGGIVQADSGICFVIDTFNGKTLMSRVMIDSGFESSVTLHNMKLLGIDPKSIEHVLLSHGHPDHFGGMLGVLRAIHHKVPFTVHSDAFIPRSIITNITRADWINKKLTKAALGKNGAVIKETSKPAKLGYAIMSTGMVERKIEFEKEVPKGRFQIIGGKLIPDEIKDDTNIVINVKGKGLIVLSMCGHSGIINTVRYAQKITGVKKIYCVMGGFHLGHPDIPKGKIEKTVNELVKMDAKYVVPLHCSGLNFKFKMMQKAPSRFISSGSGTVMDF